MTAQHPVTTCTDCGQQLLASPTAPVTGLPATCHACRGDKAPAWVATDADGTFTLLVPGGAWVGSAPPGSMAFSRRRGIEALREVVEAARRTTGEPLDAEALDCFMASFSLAPVRGPVRLGLLLAALRGDFHPTVYVR